MIYAALGDSITYGHSSTSEDKRFVDILQRSLARSKSCTVNVHVQAKPGWTSTDLRKSLKGVPPCVWAEARLVTLMIGGNDLLHAAPWLVEGNVTKMVRVADKLQQNILEIVEEVRPPSGMMIISTLYNPFPNSVVANEATQYLNKAIRTVAKRHKLLLVDVQQHFFRHESAWIDGFRRGEIRDLKIRGNPVHPNDVGHAELAKIFLRSYRRSLLKQKKPNPNKSRLG